MAGKTLIQLIDNEGKQIGLYQVDPMITSEDMEVAYFDYEQYLVKADEREEEEDETLSFEDFCEQELELSVERLFVEDVCV